METSGDERPDTLGEVNPIRLRDGTQGLVLPLLPTDRDALAEAYAELSPESKRARFLTVVDTLTPTMLDQLVDGVDGVDHVALVLYVRSDDDVFDPVAIGRIVRYPDRHAVADVAVTVRDDRHGQGVATALLQELLERRPEGVRCLLTEVLADNPASLAMLRRLGPTTTEMETDGVLSVHVDVSGEQEAEVVEVPADVRRPRSFPRRWRWSQRPA